MVKFSTGENKVYSCGDDKTLRVWDLERGKGTVLTGHTGNVNAFKMGAEWELYSVSKDLTVRKWDLRAKHENVTTSKCHHSELTHIAHNVPPPIPRPTASSPPTKPATSPSSPAACNSSTPSKCTNNKSGPSRH